MSPQKIHVIFWQRGGFLHKKHVIAKARCSGALAGKPDFVTVPPDPKALISLWKASFVDAQKNVCGHPVHGLDAAKKVHGRSDHGSVCSKKCWSGVQATAWMQRRNQNKKKQHKQNPSKNARVQARSAPQCCQVFSNHSEPLPCPRELWEIKKCENEMFLFNRYE